MDSLVGLRINHWLILEARPNGLKSMVLARCDCGKEKIIRGRSITNNSNKSCGCKRKLYARRGKRLKEVNTAIKKLYSMYRTRAVNKNIEFTLSMYEFKNITQLNCFYCKTIPANKMKKRYDEYIYNGIDRLDNSIGYTQKNSVPCCYDCNTKKGSITKEMIIKLYEYFYKNT